MLRGAGGDPRRQGQRRPLNRTVTWNLTFPWLWSPRVSASSPCPGAREERFTEGEATGRGSQSKRRLQELRREEGKTFAGTGGPYSFIEDSRGLRMFLS